MCVDDRYCNADVAKHIAYEMKMFSELCDELGFSSDESQAFTPGRILTVGTGVSERLSPLVESLLLHTRVLRDFFYNSRSPRSRVCPHCGKEIHGGKRTDDVFAEDFVPNWRDLCPPLGTYLSAQRDRLNKALAHLTTARVEYDRRQERWEVTTLQRELQPVIEEFNKSLPSLQRRWFKSAFSCTTDEMLEGEGHSGADG